MKLSQYNIKKWVTGFVVIAVVISLVFKTQWNNSPMGQYVTFN